MTLFTDGPFHLLIDPGVMIAMCCGMPCGTNAYAVIRV